MGGNVMKIIIYTLLTASVAINLLFFYSLSRPWIARVIDKVNEVGRKWRKIKVSDPDEEGQADAAILIVIGIIIFSIFYNRIT